MSCKIVPLYSVSQNKGSPNKKKYKKIFVAFMAKCFYIILTYVILTIIDQKIIEFEVLVFEICPFLQKYPK